MQKLKLDLSDLRVESFESSEQAGRLLSRPDAGSYGAGPDFRPRSFALVRSRARK